MKRILFVAFLAIAAIFFVLNQSQAREVDTDPTSIVINLSNGNTVSYAASQLDSVVYIGGTWGSANGMAMKIYVSGQAQSKDYLFSQIETITFGSSVSAVATPTFSSPSGTSFTNTTSTVTISTTTPGATIYYTTNGDTPTTNSMVYSGPITISESMTIKAIAVKVGMENSAVATANYTVTGSTGDEDMVYTRVTSTSDLVAGTKYILVYENGTAAMGAMSTSATIYGTSVSTDANFTLSSGTATVKTGSSVKYVTLGGSDGAWTFEHEDGGFLSWSSGNSLITKSSASSDSEKWTISISSGDATIANKATSVRVIRYNSGSPRFACYEGTQQAIQLYKNTSGGTQATKCATPVFSVASPTTFTDATHTVTITTGTSGATIYYTTDGSTPSASNNAGSGLNSVTVTVTETMTINAIAVKDGLTDSNVATASYTVSSSAGDSNVYELVTSNDQLVAGNKYVVAYKSGNMLMSTTSDGTGLSGTNTNLTFASDKSTVTLADGCTAAILELGGSDGAWTFANGSNYLTMSTSAVSTSLSSTVTTYAITISGEDATITPGNSRSLRANVLSGGTRFGSYTSGGNVVQLYVQAGGSSSTKCATPTFSRSSGYTFYNTTGTVTISTTTPNAIIYYTTDGTTPSENNKAGYGTGSVTVTITETMTIKAIAVKDGMTDSNVATATYNVSTSSDNNANANWKETSYGIPQSGPKKHTTDEATYSQAWRLEYPHINTSSNSQVIVHAESEYGIAYSLELDKSQRANRWSCFQMHDGLPDNNVGRNGSWTKEPNVASAYQVNTSEYTNGNYTQSCRNLDGSSTTLLSRGHVCASDARQSSVNQNTKTFYTSNCHPQYQAHNGGLWGRMETKVKSWGYSSSFRDTLYVCNGATISDVTLNGSTSSGKITNAEVQSQFGVNITGSLVIPRYWYIAVLCLKNGTYKAMAFWTEQINSSCSSTTLSSCMITIDELEERTGIDFFCNLPDDVEATVESTLDTSFWNVSN